MMRPALPKKRARAEERLASPPGTADVWARWTADGAALLLARRTGRPGGQCSKCVRWIPAPVKMRAGMRRKLRPAMRRG